MTVEEFYAREAARYDELRWRGPIGQYVHAQYARLVAECMPEHPYGQYLEIGCGTGRFTSLVADKGIALTAIDIAIEMLTATKSKLREQRSRVDVKLLRADARTMPFANESFDVVFSFNVINHVPHYERVIDEAARVLKPNGVLVVGFPSMWSLYLPYAILVNITRRSLRRGVFTRWPSAHALHRQASLLGMTKLRSRGMFHAPPLRNRVLAQLVASVLRFAGVIVRRGPLEPAASLRIVVFRKDQE
jgi:SAM-dependent methyltransferase